jgi:hypothetical protein
VGGCPVADGKVIFEYSDSKKVTHTHTLTEKWKVNGKKGKHTKLFTSDFEIGNPVINFSSVEHNLICQYCLSWLSFELVLRFVVWIQGKVFILKTKHKTISEVKFEMLVSKPRLSNN